MKAGLKKWITIVGVALGAWLIAFAVFNRRQTPAEDSPYKHPALSKATRAILDNSETFVLVSIDPMKKTSSSLSSTRRKTLCVFMSGTLQFNPKTAARRFVCLHAHRPTHSFNSLAHDCQSNSRPLIILFRRQPLKHSKKLLPVLRRNPDPRILDPKAHVLLYLFRTNSHDRLGALSDKFYSIGQQIGNRLSQWRVICHHRMRGRDGHFGDGLLHQGTLLANIFDKFLQRNWAELQIRATHTAESQDIIDELLHPLGIAADFFKVLLRDRRQVDAAIFAQHIAITGDGPKRGAQVMRYKQRIRIARPKTIHCTRVAFKRFRYMVELLAEQLLADEKMLAEMQHYQTMMGEIQDAELLLQSFDKFVRKKNIRSDSATQLREELVRRREWLIKVYMDAAGQLREFWQTDVKRKASLG